MERDIYNRAAAHYMKKHDVLIVSQMLKEFWDDYFDGNELFENRSYEYVRNRIGITKFPIY